MAIETGQALLGCLRRHSATATWRVETEAPESRWSLSGCDWDAKVIVDPLRWIGLEFEVVDPKTTRRITHHIDTDAYDISREEHHAFAREIEHDIVKFLDNLGDGNVLIGNEGTKLILMFPEGDSYRRLARGRFATTGSRLSEKPALLTGFQPVR